MIPTPFNLKIVGDSVEWLSFWGTYVGGIIGASVSFVILFLTLIHNKKEAEIERSNNRLMQLKRDLSERISDVNFMPLSINAYNEINIPSEIDRLNILARIYEQKCCVAKFVYGNDESELAKQFYETYYKFILHFGLLTNNLKDILTDKNNMGKLEQSIEEFNKILLMNQYSHFKSVNNAALKYYESEKEKLELLKIGVL